jgi:hypothetical protein
MIAATPVASRLTTVRPVKLTAVRLSSVSSPRARFA